MVRGLAAPLLWLTAVAAAVATFNTLVEVRPEEQGRAPAPPEQASCRKARRRLLEHALPARRVSPPAGALEPPNHKACTLLFLIRRLAWRPTSCQSSSSATTDRSASLRSRCRCCWCSGGRRRRRRCWSAGRRVAARCCCCLLLLLPRHQPVVPAVAVVAFVAGWRTKGRGPEPCRAPRDEGKLRHRVMSASASLLCRCLALASHPPTLNRLPLSSFGRRTNASYARWLDARKNWGTLTNRSRDLTRQVRWRAAAATAVSAALRGGAAPGVQPAHTCRAAAAAAGCRCRCRRW